MAKAKRTPSAPKDFDAGIRAQLEPYGLELNDIVAVLEEDPEMMQYVIQGPKGESLAAEGHRRDESSGFCARGVMNTTEMSSATSISNCNGNNIQLAAQKTGDYFTITYHTAETPDSLACAPNGAMLSWDNQDNPDKRKHPNHKQDPNKKPGGFKYGHVTIKTGDGTFFSDHSENESGNVDLVLHAGYPKKNGGKEPRYGSLSYVSFPKDVTFSPELVNLALMRKRERETDRKIPEAEMPKKPNNFEAFFKKNPRLGYLMLKQVNPNVPFNLTADGGANLLKYYNNLPSDSPERAALNLLAGKNIKNTMDYTAVNTAIEEVSGEVLRLRNPEAYAARQPASDRRIQFLCDATPTYIYQLQQTLNGNAKRMTSQQYKDYIAKLDKNSAEYLAISKLAKREFGTEVVPAEVKLAVANVVKDHREVKQEEIDSLFENTPGLVYYVQKEFGTQKAGGIRVTSELHEYYNNLPKDSPERRAIDELAMAHIEISEANTPKLDQAIQAMAHHYKPDRELEPRPVVHLEVNRPAVVAEVEIDPNVVPGPDEFFGIRAPNEGASPKGAPEEDAPKEDAPQLPADRAAVRDSFKKMNEQDWSQMVDDYMKSITDTSQLSAAMKQQAAEAGQRFEAMLQSLFADNGNAISCKESMQRGAELFAQYMKDGDIKDKSLDGFIKFVETERQPETPAPQSKTLKTADGKSVSSNAARMLFGNSGR